LKPSENYDPALLATLEGANSTVAFALGANVDALFQGEGGSLPSTLILDYVYGIAAYQCWASEGDNVLVKDYRESHYANIPPHSPAPPDDPDDTSGPKADDPNNPTYSSSQDGGDDTDVTTKPPKRYKRRDESDLSKAMDKLNVFLMYIHGITPEEAAERRQKEMEQEERAAQEAS
jgi:hypothetical protein